MYGYNQWGGLLSGLNGFQQFGGFQRQGLLEDLPRLISQHQGMRQSPPGYYEQLIATTLAPRQLAGRQAANAQVAVDFPPRKRRWKPFVGWKG